MVKRHAPNMFFTVEEFVEPLIDRLRPSNGKTTRQTYDEIGNGRVLGYLDRAYGGRDNIEHFIDLCDRLGFDNVILDIADKNIKTTGRFRKYLDDSLSVDKDKSEISEVNIPTTRRFRSSNPGACILCPSCKHVWSVTHKQDGDWLLNYCPYCGKDIKDEKLIASVEAKVKELMPNASILSYGKF